MSYWPLLRSLLVQRQYKWCYSPPQLVNGGLAPPPSKFYPGTKCYMIILTVNDVEYFGFGPTPSIAKHFATFEAYNSLHPLPSEEVERLRNTIPAHVIESDSDVDEPCPIKSGQELNRASLNHSDESTDGGSEDEPTYDHKTRDEKSESDDDQPSSVRESCHHDNDRTMPETRKVDCTRSSSPHVVERQGGFTSSHDELMKKIQALPSEYEPRQLVWVHDERVVNKRRDILTDVEELAQRKGVVVSYQFKKCGPSYSRGVMCIAKAAGYQFIGRHFEKPFFAKHEVAMKLFAALTKLPDVAGELSQTSQPSAGVPQLSCPYPPSSSEDVKSQDAIHQMSNFNDGRNGFNQQSSQRVKQNSLSRNPLSSISRNPIGQLQELMLKDHLNMPVYCEKVKSSGAYTEYMCTVRAKGLVANGVGCSKKLAKRHAAENLLALMHNKHMNINPVAVNRDTKVPHTKTFGRGRPFPPGRYYGSHSLGLMPHPLPPPPAVCQLPFGGSMYHHRPTGPGTPPTYHLRGRPLPPGHVVQRPYYPPPQPPQFTGGRMCPPHLPGPMSSNYMMESDTETESESDCVQSSSGLFEMIPIPASSHECQKINRHDEERQNTSPASTKPPSVNPEPVKGRNPQGTGSPTGRKRLSEEMKSPFDALSDPFHFMVRLPRERKEPWTNPPTLKELDVNNMDAKPPWCELRRNSCKSSPVSTPPRELTPLTQPQQQQQLVETHSDDLLDQKSDRDGVVPAYKRPTMNTVANQIKTTAKVNECLSSELCKSPLHNSLSGNSEADDSQNTAAANRSVQTVLDLAPVETALAADNPNSCPSPSVGNQMSLYQNEEGGVASDGDGGGVSLCQYMVEEHPLIKKLKKQGRVNVHVDENAKPEPVKTHSSVRHVSLCNNVEFFKELSDEEILVCMPSEGNIATVAK